MEQVGLVKPNGLPCLRMRGDRLTHLTSAEVVSTQPFPVNPSRLTVGFHLGSILGLKDGLPGQVQAIAVVPYIHHLLLAELRADTRIDSRQHPMTIGNGCFAPLLSRCQAAKPNFHGPPARVGHFVVQRNRLGRRILS